MNLRPVRAFLSVFAALVLSAVVFALPQSSDDAKRDAWQRPYEVMDALGVRAGSHVADVGCGHGYFVMHLARRVGAEGVVYGVDVDDDALGKLRRGVGDAKLSNVRVVRSREDDPQLPAGDLDAVLIVNAYHEMRRYDAMLRAIFVALKPHGRVAIIDAPGKNNDSRDEHHRRHTISEALVREDMLRNGFHFLRKEADFEPSREDRSRGSWFFLVFEKPGE
jgi:predicted methyltransferase